MNAASCGFGKNALISAQKTTLAPACISCSARANKSSPVAADHARKISSSPFEAMPYQTRPRIAGLIGAATSLAEMDATRTVGDDGGKSASLAPPSSTSVAIVPTNTQPPARARCEPKPSSQIQLHTAANQPIRKLTPHIPVTDKICSNAKFP